MSFQSLISGAAWALCRLLPVKNNKVVISHFYGRGFGDSPKAIALALHEADPSLEIDWLLTDMTQPLPDGIHAVSYSPLSRIYHLSTAKVWVDDCRKGARFKKKGQIYLQTWHGFALKRIERDASNALPAYYPDYAQRDADQTDVMISGSRFMTRCYETAFWYSGPIEEFGSPRNDLLFHPPTALRAQICKKLGVDPVKKLVIYAPTFRADGSLEPYSLDIPRVLDAFDRRFGGSHCMLLRLHPNLDAKSDALSCDNRTTFNATRYPDMQELLAVADVVITDYSSLMFDFALTGRPCFQFATDIAAYRQDRSFNFSLDALPFPLAENNDQLLQAIAAYDPEIARKNWQAFAQENGICEDGHAAKRCADWILKHMH